MSFKLRQTVMAVAGTLLLTSGLTAMADSTTDIVNALISKGILTEEEGALLLKGRSGEKDAAEAKAKKEVHVVNKDGIKFENEDKSVSIAVGGRIHADYRSFDHGNNKKSTSGNTQNESDTFDMRRARIALNGQLYDHYTFQLSGDFAGGTTGNSGTGSTAILDQAWLNVNYYAPIQIRAGQFKVPISMERKMSSNSLDFLERSLHDSLGSYEDRGVMVWGVPTNGITYAFAAVNGEGNKNRNEQDSRVSKPELQVNATVNFAQLMDDKDHVYHLGAGFADTDISKNNNASGTGTIAAAADNTFWVAGSNSLRTEARGVNFLKLPGLISANGVSNAINRQRFAAEAAFATGPVKMTAEWMRNSFSGDLTSTKSFDADIDAWYVSALWNITGEKFADFYKEGIFTAVKPTNNFDLGKGGGTWQLGVRYSHVDANDFNNSTFVGSTVANNVGRIAAANTATSTNTFEAGAWTVGVNFVPNPNTRLMLNYIQTNFDTPILIENKLHDNEKAITARAQWNF